MSQDARPTTSRHRKEASRTAKQTRVHDPESVKAGTHVPVKSYERWDYIPVETPKRQRKPAKE